MFDTDEHIKWVEKITNAMDWCLEELDPTTWRYLGNGQFDFDNDQDYLMFILRTE